MSPVPLSASPVHPFEPASAPVTVLLASYDGVRFLGEQLDSILSQQPAPARVVVSDDMSTDGTWELLQERSAADPRIVLMPRTGENLGAAGNFYRLFADAELVEGALVALADQDDVWLPGKLAGQLALMAGGTVDGVSSNVVAVDAEGARQLLRKDYPQRALDHVFEGPGPGCTFVLSTRLARLVQERLRDPSSAARGVDFHDWLVYGLCRARGWGWHIASTPTVDYRQHAGNAFGANLSARSAVHRLGLVRRAWHRGQAVQMVRAGLEVATPERHRELSGLLPLLERRDVRARARLAARCRQLRRRPRDQAALAVLVVAGVW